MSAQPQLDYGRCSTCGRGPLLWAGGRLVCSAPNCPGHQTQPKTTTQERT